MTTRRQAGRVTRPLHIPPSTASEEGRSACLLPRPEKTPPPRPRTPHRATAPGRVPRPADPDARAYGGDGLLRRGRLGQPRVSSSRPSSCGCASWPTTRQSRCSSGGSTTPRWFRDGRRATSLETGRGALLRTSPQPAGRRGGQLLHRPAAHLGPRRRPDGDRLAGAGEPAVLPGHPDRADGHRTPAQVRVPARCPDRLRGRGPVRTGGARLLRAAGGRDRAATRRADA